MVSVDVVRRQVLEFELEIYHILIVLLQSAGTRFMESTKSGGDSVRALCSGLMQFRFAWKSTLYFGSPTMSGHD